MVRIYEISKKWGIASVDLVDRCDELDIEASSHMSVLSDEALRLLAKDIVQRPIKRGKKRSKKAIAEKKAAAKKAADEKVAAEEAAAKKAAAEKAEAQAAAKKAKEAVAEEEEAREAERKVAEEPAVAEAPPEKQAEEAAAVKSVAHAEAPVAEAAGAAAEEKEKVAEEAVKLGRKVRKPREHVERKAAVDEELLKKQMAEAALRAARESEAENRILRRIVLPPRKKRPKKRRTAPRLRVPRKARTIIAKRPEKVTLQSPVSIKDFSQATGVKSGNIIRKLMEMGIMANVNQVLEDENVEMLGMEFAVEITLQKERTAEDELAELETVEVDPKALLVRPPVVALLGHVDHGKTSLLDKIRHSDVTAGEFGGITQHMGAYRVTTDSGHVVTFLDTPGHEAFTEMRARGADVTDIVILVVAADDGVMPQTIEAINHANAADVPIVVAINKIDRPDAQPDRVKRQLTNYGLVPEEWGGDVIMVSVSAITGEGVESLVEMLALQAEIMELAVSAERPAIGTVIEARRTEGQGIVATVLVRAGTLRPGDIVVAGVARGRVRSMSDDRGNSVDQAGPSMPVEISGLNDAPDAGDRFYVVASLQKAREIAQARTDRRQVASRAVRRRVSMENLLETIQAAGAEELKIILKTDVQGTLEVIKRTLSELSVPEVAVNIIHSAAGSVNDSDVLLADASDAVIVGFNVLVESSARSTANRSGIEIRTYNIIYNLIDEMKKALENKLAPEIRELIRGHAEVRDLFRVSRLGTIAGCRVVDGIIPRRASIRVARDGAIIYDGRIESLRHFKDDVREVREGFECGIKIAGYDDIKVGDILEAYETEEVKRTLS